MDGLKSYVTWFEKWFRFPKRTGKPGRPPLVVSAWLWLARVIKSTAGRCEEGVRREVVRGSEEEIMEWIKQTRTGSQINTA